MVVEATAVTNNLTAVFEAMVEDKPVALVAESVADRRAIDFDY